MWKKVTLFLVLVLIALFPIDIFLQGVALLTKSHFKKELGATFVYDRLFWQGRCVHFTKGHIEKRGIYTAHFEEATFLPKLSFKKGEIGGILTIEGLKVSHRQKEPLQTSALKKKGFKLNLTTIVQGGELFLEESGERMGLHLTQHVVGEHVTGNIVLEWDKPWTTDFSRTEGTWEIASHFERQDLGRVHEVVRYFLGERLPLHLAHWDVSSGWIDGKVSATLIDGAAAHIQGNFALSEIVAINPVLEIAASADQITATFAIDPPAGEHWDGDFAIRGGALRLQEECWRGMWDISDLCSTILVHEGRVESSLLRGRFMGMEGKLELDWFSPKTLMYLTFSGTARDVKPILPKRFQAGFSAELEEAPLVVRAEVYRLKEGLELKGELNTVEQQVTFGCHFGGGSEPTIDFKKVQDLAIVDQLKSQFCLSKKRLGWFSAKEVSLGRFISPFLFPQIPIELSGNVDVEGTFDERYVVIFYSGHDLVLEGPQFSLQAAHIPLDTAVHYIDLKTDEHVGYLPLKEGTYHQKNYDLTLLNTNGMVHFENNQIWIKDLDVQWDKMHLHGKVGMTICSMSDMDLCLWMENDCDAIEDGKAFLSHIVQTPLERLPLRGTFRSNAYFALHFSPDVIVTRGSVGGSAFYEMGVPCVGLKNSSLFFEYTYPESQFRVFDGMGVMCVQNWECDYTLANLGFYPEGMKLDLLVESETMPAKHIVGSCAEGVIACHGEGIEIVGEHRGEDYQLNSIHIGEWEGACNYHGIDHEMTASLIHPQQGSLTYRGVIHEGELTGVIDQMSLNLASLASTCAAGVLQGGGSVHFDRRSGVEVALDLISNELSVGGMLVDDQTVHLSCCVNAAGSIEVEVAPGLYYLNHTPWPVKGLHVSYAPDHLQLKSTVSFREHDYELFVSTDDPSWSQGEVIIQDQELLTAIWSHDDAGWQIHRIEGSLSGMDVHLAARPDSPSSDLVGEVKIDPKNMPPLLSPTLQEGILQHAVAGSYSFIGTFHLPLIDLMQSTFNGELSATDFQIDGVELASLTTSCHCEKGLIDLHNLAIKDWSGRLYLDQASLYQEDGDWLFRLHHLALQDFRLSRLTSAWTCRQRGERPLFRSLFVSSFELSDFAGRLKDQESYEGYGELRFTNFPKRTLFSNLLFIPAEITARIGLDLTMLIPVRGLINYRVEGKRVMLLDFQDMYSDGKRSRFYLAENMPAYIDLDGTLNVNIKMKQYNLLMKLAELLTISVKGSLWKPTYTIL